MTANTLQKYAYIEPLFNCGQTVSTLTWQVVAGTNGTSSGLDPTSRYPSYFYSFIGFIFSIWVKSYSLA